MSLSFETRIFAQSSAALLVAIASMGTNSILARSAVANESDEILLGQVTSVSQLSDVQPTDWAFQALQSLVERYGCIAGYPERTFRSNRSATRYEMAAAFNSCLDNINDKFATKENFEVIKALQDEFQSELATLRGQVDSLAARTDTLKAQQFSTTTKLKGEAVFIAGYVADNDDPLDSVLGIETDGGNVSADRVFLAQRARLNLDTSFNGKDLLRTRLQALNVPNLAGGDSAGTEQARLGFDDSRPDNHVKLDELFYQFKPTDQLTLKVAVIGGDYKDDVETFNPYLKNSSSGALSRFFRVNPVIHRAPGDTTLSAKYDINDKIQWAVMFAADDAENPTAGAFSTGGLCCNGEYGAMTQLGVNLNDHFRLGVSYARSQYRGSTTDITRGTADAPVTGGFASGNTSEPFGNVDTTTDNVGLNVDTKLSDGLHFSGWAGLTLARSDAAAVPTNSDVKLINWAANFVFPDLFNEGNRGALSFGQVPFIFDNGNSNIDDGHNPNFLVEAQYQFKVSKQINITPGVIAVINPNNTSSNDVIFTPMVRTTFKF